MCFRARKRGAAIVRRNGEGQAPHGYEIFQKKQDGAIKVVLQP